MENSIKLRPKQLGILAELGTKKNQLNAEFQEVARQELVIVQLVLEEAGVTGEVSDVSVNEGTLSWKKVESKKTAKGKVKKLVPQKN